MPSWPPPPGRSVSRTHTCSIPRSARLLVDRTLSELYRSGEITGIYTPYFGPPDETALNLFRLSAQPE